MSDLKSWATLVFNLYAELENESFFEGRFKRVFVKRDSLEATEGNSCDLKLFRFNREHAFPA